MSKAITGIAEIGAVVGVFAADLLSGGLLTPLVVAITPELMGLAASGIAMEAGAIADALTQNRGMNITTRQPASPRQIIYGTQRVGGTIIYQSTTGSHKDQYNFIIAISTHEIHAIENLYLDGRRVFWESGSVGNTTRNGYNFGGHAASGQHTAPNGQKYDFGGKVYCEARYGDQAEGDVIGGMTANDPNWAAGANGSPWVGGCAYVYLKIEYDPGTFPQLPEIKFTVHGKNNIFDPRTGTTGYSSNPALIAADIITDPTWGAGDNTVNQDQLIAAASICDEQVSFAGGGGGSESRYACHWHYDTTTAVGDALTTVLASCGGRLSRIGGEWYVWPAAWTSPSSLVNGSADQSLFVDSFSWTPKKSLPDLFNRINGTYTAPNYPFNAAGDLYDSNGWYEGSIQNKFPFAFQPTNFPQYAADELHGYGTGVDVYLTQDGGIELPYELNLPCVLSVSQAQRLAKIALLRNRQQGSATMALSLAALQLQPTDVVQFNYAPYGWVNKYFEVQKLTLHTDYGNGAPRTFVKVTMGENDPSVYEWSEAEELTVYDVPSAPGAVPYIVDPPTNLAIEDDASTVLVLSNGTTVPRLLVTWTPPEDTYVNNGGKIEVQYQFATLTTEENGGTAPDQPSSLLAPTQQTDGSWDSGWVDAGSASGQATYTFINGIDEYASVTVRVRAVRANGAASDWVQVDNHAFLSTQPQQVTNVSATESPYLTANGIQSLVSVDFTVASGDANFSQAKVYFTGYAGNSSPQLMAEGATSPIQFLCDTTHEAVVVSVVAENANGSDAPFALAPTCILSLDGVQSAPPAPSIASAQVALPNASGWQFAFNVVGGLEAEAGLVSGYRVYHSKSNVAPVPPDGYYTAYPQPSTNAGQIVVQETTQDILFYWVSAYNSAGYESALTPVPFVYVDPGAEAPSAPAPVQTTKTFVPRVNLNGWAANAHAGNYEGGSGLGSEVWGTNGAATLAYTNPANVFDGNQSTAASISESHTHQYAGCIWDFSSFPGLYTGASVVSSAVSIVSEILPTSGPVAGHADIWYSINGGSTWSKLYAGYATRLKQTDTITLAANQDITKVQVMAFMDSHDDIAHKVYEISLAVTQSAPAGPEKVTGVKATLVNGDVQITWNSLIPTSRTDILNYEVTRVVHGGGYAQSKVQTTISWSGAASYSWTDVEAHDGTFDYYVIADNSTGASQPSDVANLGGADSLIYASGATIESLKPAQAGADVTAGQSIDVLSGSQGNYRQAVMALAPVGYWRFSETSGATVKDVSGHGNNGTYTPSTAGVTYAQPGALTSDPDTCAALAAGTYASVPNSASIQLNTFTYAMWVKLDPTNTNTYVAIANTSGWQIQRHAADNWIYLQINTSAASDQELQASSTPVIDGNWHFIVAAVSGSTAYLSIDGANWLTRTINVGNGVSTTVPLSILSNYRGGIAASVDEVSLFSTLLSIQDVKALYALGTHGVYRTVDQVPDGLTRFAAAEAGADVTANNKAKALNIPDTRNVNELPSFYRTLGVGVYTEFKQQSVIGGPDTGMFVTLYTEVLWQDTTGGKVVQWYTDAESQNEWTRTGFGGDDGWNPWSRVQAGADVTSANAVTLLQNPDFISGDVGWAKQAPWEIGTIASINYPPSPSGVSSYLGIFSSPSTPNTAAITNSKKTPCSAGTVVSASCYVIGSTGATCSSNGIRVNFYDINGTVIGSQQGNTVPSNIGYSQSRAVLTAPANTAYVQIDFAIFNGVTGSGVWAVSGFSAAILPNSVDEVPDGSTYLRMPGSNMDQNRRAIIDFGQGAHINKNLDNIAPGPSGAHAVQKYAIANGGSSEWMLFGTWVFGQQGSSLTLTYHGGTGYNTSGSQQASTIITVRSGNGTQAPNISGVSYYTSGGSDPILGVIVNASNGSTSPSNNAWDIWINWNTFTNGHIEVALSPNDTFTYNGGIGGSAPSGPTAVVATGGRVFNTGGTGLDAVNDGFVRYAAAESGAHVTKNHALTVQVKLGTASSLTPGQWVAANGLAWTAQTSSTSDVYNIQGDGSISIGGTAGTGMVRFGVFVDGNTGGTNYGSGFIYVTMPTSAQVSGSGAFFGSITGLSPGTHTIQVYVWNNTTQSATINDGFAICQRIF